MASFTEVCLLHTRPKSTEKLTTFTEKSWRTYTTYARFWDEVGVGRLSVIASETKDCWSMDVVGTSYTKYKYHRSCYQDFTNKSTLTKAQKRTKNEDQGEVPGEPTSKKQQRSSSSMMAKERVLPRECIFHLAGTRKLCGKTGLKFVKSKTTGSRQQEKLSQCLTVEAERKLKAAAAGTNDENLLMHIRDKDLIAIEVSYHKSCYSAYMSACESSTSHDKRTKPQYAEAFDVVAEEVEQSVILQGNVIKMSKLSAKFIELVVSNGGDIPNFRTEKLKKKLMARFGQKISFWHPKKRTKCELVYSEFVPKGTLLETSVESCSSESETSDDSDMDSPYSSFQINETEELYHAAQVLRDSLNNVTSHVKWPPTSDKLNQESVDAIIPCQLHNFLALLIAPSLEELDFTSDTKMQLPLDLTVRLQSIAQDIIFAHSRGRVVTPKHVSLGVSIRHLTNNVQVLSLMNKFGHSVSHTYLQELDTAIAKQVIENEDVLPPNINPCQFTTAIWDNIDLSEETLSGKGTTHHTNGILVQRQCSDESQSLPKQSSKRTGERSFEAQTRPTSNYFQGKKVGPGSFQIDSSLLREDRSVGKNAETQDFIWMLLRLPPMITMPNTEQVGAQVIPGWSGFNSLKRKEAPEVSAVGYLPAIPSSPTDMSTVHTLLMRTMAICSKLQQEEIVIVLDQAIYCKALQILWREKERFSKIVLRLGAFHTTCVMLGVIGKRFEDTGLGDVMIESGVLASGSLKGVMSGKHYNRSIRIFRIVYEALHRLRWQSFLETLDMTDTDVLNRVTSLLQVKRTDPNDVDTLITNSEFEKIQAKYNEFCNLSQSTMFSFWSSFLEMMQAVLNFIKATRTGNFELHLASIRSMLPWMFAYDRINYMRYCTVYWVEMMSLPETHPSINHQLYSGEFVVQRSKLNTFGQIACDMAIEQTYNRDTKSPGGIIGFSLNRGAVERWTLSSPERASAVAACRSMAGMNESNYWIHKDHSRLNRDETDIRKVTDTFMGFVNPFSPECDQLVHLSAGYVPPTDVLTDLLSANTKGEELFLGFVKERLLTDQVDFFTPMKLLKSKTFKSIKKVVKVSSTLNIQEDRSLFGSILVVNNKLTRQVNLKDLFEYTLGTYPYSLATTTGCLVKTNKAKLLHLLEKDHVPADIESIKLKTSAWVFDGMAVLQQLVKSQATTFGEFGSQVLSVMLSVTRMSRCKRIDFVPDRYLPVSIKAAERDKRGKSGDIRVRILSRNQKKTLQWKKFLANSDNKSDIIEFLFQEWQNPEHAARLKGISLFVGHGEKCHSLSSNGSEVTSTQENNLYCTHEEADTRMFLHAVHAATECEAVVIRSPDTDVAVLGITHNHNIHTALYLDIGNKNNRRLIELGKINETLGQERANALVGFHAFTGCDSVSSFFGKGKAKCFALFLKDDETVATLSLLGSAQHVSDSLMTQCETLVCRLYGSQTITKVNQLRHELFTKTRAKSGNLPPNYDSLVLHVKRANYQAHVWMNALEQRPNITNPAGHGWKMDGENLIIEWMTLLPAPKAILELMSCRCRTDCSTRSCQCRKNSLHCTEACRCGQCTNQVDEADTSDDDGDSDEEEDV